MDKFPTPPKFPPPMLPSYIVPSLDMKHVMYGRNTGVTEKLLGSLLSSKTISKRWITDTIVDELHKFGLGSVIYSVNKEAMDARIVKTPRRHNSNPFSKILSLRGIPPEVIESINDITEKCCYAKMPFSMPDAQTGYVQRIVPVYDAGSPELLGILVLYTNNEELIAEFHEKFWNPESPVNMKQVLCTALNTTADISETCSNTSDSEEQQPTMPNNMSPEVCVFGDDGGTTDGINASTQQKYYINAKYLEEIRKISTQKDPGGFEWQNLKNLMDVYFEENVQQDVNHQPQQPHPQICWTKTLHPFCIADIIEKIPDCVDIIVSETFTVSGYLTNCRMLRDVISVLLYSINIDQTTLVFESNPTTKNKQLNTTSSTKKMLWDVNIPRKHYMKINFHHNEQPNRTVHEQRIRYLTKKYEYIIIKENPDKLKLKIPLIEYKPGLIYEQTISAAFMEEHSPEREYALATLIKHKFINRRKYSRWFVGKKVALICDCQLSKYTITNILSIWGIPLFHFDNYETMLTVSNINYDVMLIHKNVEIQQYQQYQQANILRINLDTIEAKKIFYKLYREFRSRKLAISRL